MDSIKKIDVVNLYAEIFFLNYQLKKGEDKKFIH
jgi:hypothetical protein